MTAVSIERFQAVRLVALDIDGVLSDGTVSLDDKGVERRVFDIKDGLGIVRLVESGRQVVVISSSAATAGVARLERLGVSPVHTGVTDKLEVLTDLVDRVGLSWQHVAYMGDDLPDQKCLNAAGLSAAPADAVAAIRGIVDYVTTARGGRGAVRELADIIVDGVFPEDRRG